jgi:hypothetical protein
MPIVYNKQPVLRNKSMHHLISLYIASITARYLVLLEFKAVNFTCHSSTHVFLLSPTLTHYSHCSLEIPLVYKLLNYLTSYRETTTD